MKYGRLVQCITLLVIINRLIYKQRRAYTIEGYNKNMANTDKYHKDKYAPSYVPDKKYRPKPTNPNKKVEKVWGFTVLSFLALLAIFVVKYLVDFLLIPRIFPGLFPFSVGALLVWLVSSLLFSFIALKFITRMGFFYPAADIVYGILVWAFPCGLYGLESMLPALAGAMIAYVILRIIQRVMLWIFILVGFVRM